MSAKAHLRRQVLKLKSFLRLGSVGPLEGESKNGSASRSVPGLDASSMGFDDFLHNRKTKSLARFAALFGNAKERFENLRQILFRDSGPRIGHEKPDEPLFFP